MTASKKSTGDRGVSPRRLVDLEEPAYVAVGSPAGDGSSVDVDGTGAWNVHVDPGTAEVHGWLSVPRTVAEMDAHGCGPGDPRVGWLVGHGLVAVLRTRSALFPSFNGIRVVPTGSIRPVPGNAFEFVPADGRPSFVVPEELAEVLSAGDGDLPQAIRSASVTLIMPAGRIASVVFGSLYWLLEDGHVRLLGVR